jgi:hypothetical protein
MANRTHVPGQLQGFMLQVRHMLFELISLDDIIVSLEELDDIAVHSLEGYVIAEQVKSVTSDSNPTTNRSVVFWKTLYNWLNYINAGSLVLDKTTFRMVVASSHGLTAGDIISQFHKASTRQEAQEALNYAKLNLWGKDEKLKSSVPDTYSKYLDVLFAIDNENLITEIIIKFSFDVHENDYDDKMIKRFNAHVMLPEFQDSLLVYMLGWVNERVNEYTKQGKSAFISSVDYRNALTAQRRMYDQRNAIPVLSSEITADEACTEVENQDIYIQQLDLIEMDFDDKLEAASDYLRTKAEVTMRAEKGLFTPLGLPDYNDKICRLWKSKLTQSSFLSTRVCRQ